MEKPEAKAPSPSWHCESAESVLEQLGSNTATGLGAAEAEARLRRHGPNAIREAARRSAWRMFLDQFTDFMIIVLMAAAVVSGLIGEPGDTIAIVAIVVLNAVIGFVQEYRAEKAIAALKKLAAATARVLRDGHVREIPAGDLVPGDIVLLEAGALVPADLRMVQCAALKIEEAALTGESVPAEKHDRALPDAALPVADRRNMAYKGTAVAYGRGTGVVVATGMGTELGRIAGLLTHEEEVRTPLQKRLTAFTTRLAWAVLAICAIVFVAGLLRGEPLVLMFLTSVSLAVAAIPEALPAVVTISLALGAQRMVQQNALIRRLPAVETLGSVTYICSDKTGTLTENRMRVERLRANGEDYPGASAPEPWPTLLRAMAQCNDAKSDDRGNILGDPTEVALLRAAAERGYEKGALEASHPRVKELPFDSERMRMATLHPAAEGVIAFVKGAPEAVLQRTPWRLTSGGLSPLDAAEVLAEADALAAEGLRVLAFACRNFDAVPGRIEDAEEELCFLGLAGLLDPPRPEAGQAVAECRSAGIVPVMITGDHPATANAIAGRLGILDRSGEIVTGRELSAMSEDELARRVRNIRVYARVDPEQKIRIVKALQSRKEFVAMTGDGVNDAPALKRAEIGIAMGRVGTDVAREASSMVLLDDNFATIVHAVREGRRIFDNIRKFIKYTMTSNSGEIWTIFLAPFLGLPIPLLPIHILWINLVTDGLPGLALGVEPAERKVMQRAPRAPDENIFAHGMWQHILWVGLLMGAVSLFTQAWAYESGSPYWQTMTFTVLCLSQLGHAMAVRSESASLFSLGISSNLPLAGAVALTLGLQLAVIYLPAANAIFKTQPLPLAELLICFGLSTVVFWAVEAEKWLVRRGWIYREPAGRG
ncbi:MAG TPA: cation-translocating P-type ATPase [Burkholderiales bacterium]|nr:cation-translocating P-type ATPase [Burkholderiales bacterium]